MTNRMEYLTFFNGQKMPILGLGTAQAVGDDVEKAIDKALEIGYRHIDTAQRYNNEAQIGRALKKWLDSGKIKREDLFIVTKLPSTGNRAECVEKHLKQSLHDLQLDYVDLYLVHQPTGYQDVDPKDNGGKMLLDVNTDHVSLWKAMEAQVDAGRARSIGLSNFNARQVKHVWQLARIRPANLQVELHVYFQQAELRAFCRALDVTVCAYIPLGGPHRQPPSHNANAADANKIDGCVRLCHNLGEQLFDMLYALCLLWRPVRAVLRYGGPVGPVVVVRGTRSAVDCVNFAEDHPFVLDVFLDSDQIFFLLSNHIQLTNPVVSQIAQKHSKTNAQILLRYLIQLGVAVIPKSTNPDRLQQNFDVFDFELSPEDMDMLERLDKGPAGRQVRGHIPEMANHPEYPYNERY